MDTRRIKTLISVAKLYYESNYNQDEIAKKLNLSRPTVSRMLNYCKEKKIVQIKIINPFEEFATIERELEEKYKLKKAIVTYSSIDSPNEILNAICAKAASYLNENISDGDAIGVCWGETLYQIAKMLNPRMVRGVRIVQLKGGISHTLSTTHAHEIVEIFSQRFNAIGSYLPLPTLFSSNKTKQIVDQDPYIQSLLQAGIDTNIALFTVGAVQEDSLLFKLGYFSQRQRKMLSKVAVGDIVSHLIDKDGKLCDESLDERTCGISLENLKKKTTRILVAGGSKKHAAIQAALNGGYPNILITDQFTAHSLI